MSTSGVSRAKYFAMRKNAIFQVFKVAVLAGRIKGRDYVAQPLTHRKRKRKENKKAKSY